MRTLYLASMSPRRRALIQLLDLPVEVLAVDVDEEIVTLVDPAQNAIERARIKAKAAKVVTPVDALIVASDTVVALGQDRLGKPVDADDARQTLTRLRGQTHQVHTGIVLLDKKSGAEQSDVATIDVPMRDYSDAEIEAYIDSGDPFDKAGSYGIQHPVFEPVLHLMGCYAGVMGFPLCHLTRALARWEIIVSADVPAACQQYNEYNCTVFETILDN
ncbi:MAG TPA: Maf family protein [Anaerolineae bacterium]|nr:Maf family protein [Anaerolineae bacterium]